jgi:hypothetical protein
MTEDNVVDLNTQILISIRDELGNLRTEIGGLRTEMRSGLERVNARLDNLIDTMGGKSRDHERRLTDLEGRVDKLERAGTRRRPTGPRRR